MLINQTRRFLRISATVERQLTRCYATVKRFYKNASIIRTEGGNKFEIVLDQRRLKTPKGAVFNTDSEALALAVATEWNAQQDKIVRSDMHLTTLCNTVLDNPNNLTKYDISNYIVSCLDTDAILFQSRENEELFELQLQEWDPVIKWFNQRFDVSLNKSTDMEVVSVSEQDKTTLTRHLMSYNFSALTGFVYGVDTLKSGILMFACVENFLSPEKAVLLSRLEEEYQSDRWGRVKWAHDLNQQDSQAKLAAVKMFVYFSLQSSRVQQKL